MGLLLVISLASKASARGEAPEARPIVAPATALEDYAGRYLASDETLLVVEVRGGILTARPILWTSLQPLREAGPDRFVVDDRPERTLAFTRDAGGRVVSVRIDWSEAPGELARVAAGAGVPVELLLRGDGAAAAAAVLARHPEDPAAFVALGARAIEQRPSRAAAGLAYLEALEPHVPPSARLHRGLATGLLRLGRREEARRRYEAALELAPGDADAAFGLRLLGGAPERGGGRVEDGLPFALDALFQPPRPEEIAAVRKIWKRRDLRPRGVRTEEEGTLDLGHVRARVATTAP